ncbi:MAG: type II toxin-antitoxin system VapC family toxin [Holophaga sp.]|jgi:predicted nucleic-acid-binding protein
MRAVDTNVLVRALAGDDAVQSPAALAFIKKEGPVWISQVVLVQTIWVLDSVYGFGKQQLIEALKRIIDNKDMALEDPGVVRSALALFEARGRTGFDDFLVLEIARKAGHLPLATFDKPLGKAEGVHCLAQATS